MTKGGSSKQDSFPHSRSQKTSPLKYVGRGTKRERERLLEGLSDAFLSVDTHWYTNYVNLQAEMVTGKTRSELLGRKVWEVFPFPVDSELYLKAHQALNQQSIQELTQFHPVLRKWYWVRLYPFQDGLYAFGKDITERKHAQEVFGFEATTTWDESKSIILTNLQGEIIYWNEGASRLFGYNAADVLGKTPDILYPDMEKNQLASDLARIRNGQDYHGIWKGRRKDGSTVWIKIKTTLLWNAERKPIGYIGTAQESKQREPAEEQFLSYARLAQNNLDAVIATDTNYNILSWNEAAERLYGWKQEEVYGKYVNAVLPTQFFATSGSEASALLRSRGYWKGKVVQPHKNGTPLTLLASVSVIKDEAGKIIGAVAANREIDERGETSSQKIRVDKTPP